VTLLVFHAAVTWFMAGLIWTIQLVHYPLFAEVGEANFTGYQRAHVGRITPLVAPVMGLELVTAALLALDPPAAPNATAYYAGLGLVVFAWGVTGAVSVPCHAGLENRFDAGVHRRLVRSNWLRTSAWTVRAGLVCWFLIAAAGTASS
jgi:hypothetical protein